MSLSIQEVIYNLPKMYATTEKGKGRSPTLVLQGPPGIAKTAMFLGEGGSKSLAVTVLERSFNRPVEVVEVVLAEREAMDVRGVLIPYKNADGSPAAAYTLSDIAMKVKTALEKVGDDGIVILLLDEVWQSDPIMQRAISPVLNAGRIGDWQAPDNVWIIGTANRQEDRAGTYKVFSHIMNRVVIFDVHMDVDAWIEGYAIPAGLPTIISAFARFMPEDFSRPVPRDPAPYLTFRSLTRVGKLIRDNYNWQDMFVDTNDLFFINFVKGAIGGEACTNFLGYAEMAADLPTTQEIAKDPQKAKLPENHRVDAQHAIVTMMLAKATPDNILAFWDYGTRLNREFQAQILEKLRSKEFGGVLLAAPQVSKWLADPMNRRLVRAL